ncbi:MAG: hypothetical protein U9Q92_01075 [archaeon]|nr:hypothetical protein [archaeon]
MNISISYLQSSGFYQFMLPFLLVTTITYAVFHYVKTKSKGDFVLNNLAIAIISAVIGLFATNHRPLRELLFKWMPLFIIILIVVFLVLIVKKLFEGEGGNKDYLPLLVILVLIIVIIGAYGVNNFSKYLGMDAENILWGVGFLIFALILWAAYKHEGGGSEPKKEG